MATTSAGFVLVSGGSFLFEERAASQVFAPEDFTEEQLIASTVEDFASNEIAPNIEKIECKDFALSRQLLKKAGELGFNSVEIPEAYGGLEMDKATAMLIADRIAGYASFAVTWGGQTGIAMLPLIYFGTQEQKEKYLPGLASGEIVGAYALSEASSGSDALNCRAHAKLSPDGKHYILNGEKMWITTAGFADLFTVFAKIDGEKFTAFLVDRSLPGFSIGQEEHKMGLRGSSTCAINFDDCKVPAENVLGEIGKGHIIAFNILNVGRMKIGAMCVGGARTSLENAIGYAKQRQAFGKTIADFGLVREKLANMAIGVYTGEAVVYRTVGMMDAALGAVDKTAPDAMQRVRKAIEEYAIECSIVKVWGSEMIDYVVDETVQVYGGYGFVEDYPAERAYRDARANRIFEGTNEINRLIIAVQLFKRAQAGHLPLMPTIKKLTEELLSGAPMAEEPDGPLAAERKLVANAKKLALLAAGSAAEKAMQDRQEIAGAIADMLIETYAMESALLRTLKIMERDGEAAAALPLAMTRVYLFDGMAKLETTARKILAAATDGEARHAHLAAVRRLTACDPFDTLGLRQQIAQQVIEREKYGLA